MKKYVIIGIVVVVIIAAITVFAMKRKQDAVLKDPKPTPEVKAAVEKALGKEYLATKGKVRTYGESLTMLFGWWANDPNNFKEWAIDKAFATYKDKAGKPNFPEAIKTYIEHHANQ